MTDGALENISVRPFQPDDAPAVSCMIGRDLREVNSRDYPPETIESMVHHYAPDNVIKMGQQRRMLVAECAGVVVATGSLAGNWILSFFVSPDLHGRGVGRLLLKRLEEMAQVQGFDETFIPAGFTAISFYEKCGYSKAVDQSKATKDWIIVSKRLAGTP